MDVKPRPLSCMKKLPLTCEIKLQIHRPGIEKTLPAGPREAGSSPAGLWQGPGEALGLLSSGAGDEGSALLMARGQALHQSEVLQEALREPGGMRQRWELSRAASGHLPEVREGKDGENFWNMSSAGHTLHPPQLLLSLA